jgi:hypothetical protein
VEKGAAEQNVSQHCDPGDTDRIHYICRGIRHYYPGEGDAPGPGCVAYSREGCGCRSGPGIPECIERDPALKFQHDTQVGAGMFAVTAIVQQVLLLIGIGLAAMLAIALVMACYPRVPAVLQKAGGLPGESTAPSVPRLHWALIFLLQSLISQMQCGLLWLLVLGCLRVLAPLRLSGNSANLQGSKAQNLKGCRFR